MELPVRLRRLDTLINVQYDNVVVVFINANPFGTCHVVKSITGEHFGILTLNNNLNQNLWVHYNVENRIGSQHLLDINFKTERSDHREVMLYQIVVDDEEIIMNFKN